MQGTSKRIGELSQAPYVGRDGLLVRIGRPALPLLVIVALAACASGPLRMSGRDGPEANPPPDLAGVPDAEPKLEDIRSGGPNKPYDVLGRSYVPITKDAPFTEYGLASWYGRAFHGKRTASGEVYNMYAMTAAHPTLPIPSYARVRNPMNGREIVVRINDRGPFHTGRIVDLSYTAALKLDLLRGVGPVELQRITFDEIRTGTWRQEGDADRTQLAAVGVPLGRSAPPPGAALGVPISDVATVAVTPERANVPSQAAAPASASTTAVDSMVTTDSAAARAPLAAEGVAATTPVEPVVDAPAARAFTVPARGFWVQIGAFRARDGAETFQRRVATQLDWISPLLAVFNDAALFRLQAGPYPSRDEARGVAERVRDELKLVPVIVERR
jgi:rare lipoprotein A